jgi:homoserine O-acetyltransferase/O-succinyltransferase
MVNIIVPAHVICLMRRYDRLHKLLLDDLDVKQIAAVVGGSMGGMLVLEWAYFGKDYVRNIVPIATSSRHSAWGISWGEAQRQSIYADPKYDDGYYTFDDPPVTGLGAARMSALLTYRSRNSFETRFGRNIPDPTKRQTIVEQPRAATPSEAHFHIHNDGHRVTRSPLSRTNTNNSSGPSGLTPTSLSPSPTTTAAPEPASLDPQFSSSKTELEATTDPGKTPTTTYFSAQSYLRYQGQKFVKRFDSNCYIAITRKLDTHDVSRHRAETIAEALAMIEQPTLVLGIESDGLFTFAEQKELAEHIQNARLREIVSQEGHDAFLLQFEQVNRYILDFFRDVLPELMSKEVDSAQVEGVGQIVKSSVFGEAEVEDITAW